MVSPDRLKDELLPAALTVVAGLVTLAASFLFRDQLLIPKDAARLVGLAVLYVGMALFLWAALHLKEAIGGLVAPRRDRLVVSGPYRYVRHPAYVAMLIAMIGAAVVLRSLVGLLVSFLVFLPAEIHRARLEEQALEHAFPESWRTYASHTGFFLPLWRKHV